MKNKHELSAKIVEHVTPETMAGDTELKRQLNAYLTKQFILSRGVPDDECLHEAEEIIEIFKRYNE